MLDVYHQKQIDSERQIFFHLQFHPQDPPARDNQKLWQELVAEPPDDTPLLHIVQTMKELKRV